MPVKHSCERLGDTYRNLDRAIFAKPLALVWWLTVRAEEGGTRSKFDNSNEVMKPGIL